MDNPGVDHYPGENIFSCSAAIQEIYFVEPIWMFYKLYIAYQSETLTLQPPFLLLKNDRDLRRSGSLQFTRWIPCLTSHIFESDCFWGCTCHLLFLFTFDFIDWLHDQTWKCIWSESLSIASLATFFSKVSLYSEKKS